MQGQSKATGFTFNYPKVIKLVWREIQNQCICWHILNRSDGINNGPHQLTKNRTRIFTGRPSVDSGPHWLRRTPGPGSTPRFLVLSLWRVDVCWFVWCLRILRLDRNTWTWSWCMKLSGVAAMPDVMAPGMEDPMAPWGGVFWTCSGPLTSEAGHSRLHFRVVFLATSLAAGILYTC